MSHAQLLQLARQGDTQAIITLLNRCLQVRRVTLVEANLDENCLELKLVSPKGPNQYKLIPFLRDEISSLGIEFLETVKVQALTDIASAPAWETSITLEQDWSSTKHLADAVVRGKRTTIADDGEDEEIVEIEENLVEEPAEVSPTPVGEDPPTGTEIVDIPDEPIHKRQPVIFLLPIALSFTIGLLTGISLGYFFSLPRTGLPEPTVYSIPGR